MSDQLPVSVQEYSIRLFGKDQNPDLVSVQEFGQFLVGVESAMTAAVNRVGGSNAATKLQIKTQFRKSSIVVDFIMAVAPIVASDPELSKFLASQVAGRAYEFLFGEKGLLSILTKSRGQQVRIEVNGNNNNVLVVTGPLNNSTILAQNPMPEVTSALASPKYQNYYRRTLNNAFPPGLFRKNAIETAEVYKKGQSVPTTTLSDSEVEYLTVTERNTLDYDEQRMDLEVLRVRFDDNEKWRFSDDGVEFSASIEDEEFLAGVYDRSISFESGGRIDCLVGHSFGRRNGKKFSDFVILKVFSRKRGANSRRITVNPRD